MTLLWGTSGIRKVFHSHADGFTPELALNLGLSLGTYVNGGTVVVAKDIRTAALPRLSSVHQHTKEGLC